MEIVGAYLREIQILLDNLNRDVIEQVISVLQSARLAGRQVFIIGNGGSAATASHLACDLAKNARLAGWPPFRVLALTDNVPLLTAYANDEGYDQVFAQQLANFVQADDVVLAISTSGNSPNILRAVELAARCGALGVAWTGFAGGQLASLAHVHLNVPSQSVPQVEDVHAILAHLITNALRSLSTPLPALPTATRALVTVKPSPGAGQA